MKNIFKIIIIVTGLLFSQTSKQIKQAKEIIQQTGMSERQARDAARARGFTDMQIENAIKKEKSSKKSSGESGFESAEQVSLPDYGKSNQVLQGEDGAEQIMVNELPIVNEDDLGIMEKQGLDDNSGEPSNRPGLTYFGYDIFKQDPALFQASSVGAVDPDYIIGPSDEIIVMLWGETQFRQVLNVDREGFIFISEVLEIKRFVECLCLN